MKVFIVDSSNNNKVARECDTKAEAREWIKSKFQTANTNESWGDFKENFFFVTKGEMEESIEKYGDSVKNYFRF